MKAIVFKSKGVIELSALPDPEPADNEVLIDVKASGVCHTDFEVLKDNYGTGAFPVVPGHEYSGVVSKVGSDVRHVRPGDRVVVDPNLECGSCQACRRGWAHLCQKLRAYGVTTNGGFSERSVVRAANVHPIGVMGFSRAALAEPMGCVLNGLDAVHATWMDEALIFGAGPMGLLFGLALRMEGTSRVTFCDIEDSRLALAKSLDFETVFSTADELQNLRHSVDLAVDATGVPKVAEKLPHYLINGGKGLFFGVCPSDARIQISPFEIFRRQLTLSGSHSLNHNIPRALDAITRLGSSVDAIVSHRLSLREVAHILSTKPPKGSLKVQWQADR